MAREHSANLVLLPGLNNTAAVFDGVLAHMPPAVLARSSTLPALTSVEAIAQAILPGLPDRFWLAGFSFGGYVALALLEAVPERVQGIALICTAPQADTPAQRDKREASIAIAQSGGYEDMINAQAANAFHPNSLSNPALMQARQRMVHDYGAARFIAHARAAMARPDRGALLDGTRPTLVVAASHDKVFPPADMKRLADAVPGAGFAQVEGAGHLVPLEKPAELASLLSTWMSEKY